MTRAICIIFFSFNFSCPRKKKRRLYNKISCSPTETKKTVNSNICERKITNKRKNKSTVCLKFVYSSIRLPNECFLFDKSMCIECDWSMKSNLFNEIFFVALLTSKYQNLLNQHHCTTNYIVKRFHCYIICAYQSMYCNVRTNRQQLKIKTIFLFIGFIVY